MYPEYIDDIEKLMVDLETSIPTIDDIVRQTDINVTSIKKYFPQKYRAKFKIISGAYIIFTELKERYIGCSINVLGRIYQHIDQKKIGNILVVYIYETDDIDAKRLESWLIHTLNPELNINYPNKELIYYREKRQDYPNIIVDRKRITMPNSRKQIFIGLDPRFLRKTGFEPGIYVNLIYEENKITITKEIKDVKI